MLMFLEINLMKVIPNNVNDGRQHPPASRECAFIKDLVTQMPEENVFL